MWAPLIAIEVLLLELFSGGVTGDFLPAVMALSQAPIFVWTAWNYLRLTRSRPCSRLSSAC